MSTLGLLLQVLFAVWSVAGSPDGACLPEGSIFKQTWTSSDSDRDNEWARRLLPYVHSEYTPHFQQGLCAKQSKIELNEECFKIHAPQTWEHPIYQLDIEWVEEQFTLKMNAAANKRSHTNKYKYHYDAFLDFSMAFWVPDIDIYIELYEKLVLNYILMQWTIPHPTSDGKKTFYSVLVHSPNSQILYELISDDSKYLHNPRYHFLRTSMRVYFDEDSSVTPYPWRKPHSHMVPLRISRGTSKLQESVEFYTDILEAETLYIQSKPVVDAMGNDRQTVQYVFFKPLGATIQVSFFQRPSKYTYGTFTLAKFENALQKEFNELVPNEYCGDPRWFDNHYGHSPYGYPGLLDRILDKVRAKNLQFRVKSHSQEHRSPTSEILLKEQGVELRYGLEVVEPGGQTVQVGGDFSDVKKQFIIEPPGGNPQWCAIRCPDLGEKEEDTHMRQKHSVVSLPLTLVWIAMVAPLFAFVIFLCRNGTICTRDSFPKRSGQENQPLLGRSSVPARYV